MNLFFLHEDPHICAEYHCDKHVVKMLLEIVQMLFTAHHVLGTPTDLLAYKPIKNSRHPMCIWVRLSLENYTYASQLALYLAQEYTIRYSRIHSCEKHAKWLSENIPCFAKGEEYSNTTVLSKKNILNLTRVPLCMPSDSIHDFDTIKSYRRYYLIHKKYFAKWSCRSIPYWFHYSTITKYW